MCVRVGCRVEIKQRYSKRCPRVFFLNVRYIYATRSLTLILSGASAAARSSPPPVSNSLCQALFLAKKKWGSPARNVIRKIKRQFSMVFRFRRSDLTSPAKSEKALKRLHDDAVFLPVRKISK